MNPIYAKWARKLYLDKIQDIHTIHPDYQPSGTITSPILLSMPWPTDGRSLWIKGPTSVGKSTWALLHSPKPSLYVRHLDTLLKFKPQLHKSLIFDDMCFTHLPRETQLQLVDLRNQLQVHVRYGVASIPAALPRVFLSNVEIFSEDPAISARITKILLEYQ